MGDGRRAGKGARRTSELKSPSKAPARTPSSRQKNAAGKWRLRRCLARAVLRPARAAGGASALGALWPQMDGASAVLSAADRQFRPSASPSSAAMARTPPPARPQMIAAFKRLSAGLRKPAWRRRRARAPLRAARQRPHRAVMKAGRARHRRRFGRDARLLGLRRRDRSAADRGNGCARLVRLGAPGLPGRLEAAVRNGGWPRSGRSCSVVRRGAPSLRRSCRSAGAPAGRSRARAGPGAWAFLARATP